MTGSPVLCIIRFPCFGWSTRYVTSMRTFSRKILSNRLGYEVAIVRMQNGQPFRECRNAFRWIETEENERLRRPIIEYAIGPKRPAPHMSQSFPFTQVKFASL